MAALEIDRLLGTLDLVCRSGLPKAITLKTKQREVLEALAQGRNVCASLPTGYGKSLCFALPALAWRWRVWVVSPLVALMEDQAESLRKMNICAVAMHSALGPQELRAREKVFLRGEADIIFVSPEKLVRWEQSGFMAQLRALGELPKLVALDEFHCFEEWRAFRPDFGECLAILRRLAAAGRQILALSATVSKFEAGRWMEEFCDTHQFVEGPLVRPELRLLVAPLEEEPTRWVLLLNALRGLKKPSAALVYCATRGECDQVTAWLTSAGWPATGFHAGLPASVRSERVRAFRAGHLRVVCATTAFGMGIDYPHVDRVIHFSMPRSLENYWQEAGRAGRSGAQALAIAFWRRSEVVRAAKMKREDRIRFCSLWEAWASHGCKQRAVASYLGISMQYDCGVCDRCMSQQRNWPAALQEWKELCENLPWWLSKFAESHDWMRDKILNAP